MEELWIGLILSGKGIERLVIRIIGEEFTFLKEQLKQIVIEDEDGKQLPLKDSQWQMVLDGLIGKEVEWTDIGNPYDESHIASNHRTKEENIQ